MYYKVLKHTSIVTSACGGGVGGDDEDEDGDSMNGSNSDSDTDSSHSNENDDIFGDLTDDEEQIDNMVVNMEPICSGSHMVTHQFNSLLLGLHQRHNISPVALYNILKLFKMSLSEGNNSLGSSYRFERQYEKELEYTYTKYSTCTNCEMFLTNDICTNISCNKYETSGKGDNSSEVYITDIVPELKRLIPGTMYMYIVPLTVNTQKKFMKVSRF